MEEIDYILSPFKFECDNNLVALQHLVENRGYMYYHKDPIRYSHDQMRPLDIIVKITTYVDDGKEKMI